MCSQEGMMMANLSTINWGRQWEYVLLMFDQVGVGRDLHW